MVLTREVFKPLLYACRFRLLCIQSVLDQLLSGESHSKVNKSRIEKESKAHVINQQHIDHSLFTARDNFECNYILRHLEENNWNVCRTAEVLKVDRTYLYKLMQKYSIIRAKNKQQK